MVVLLSLRTRARALDPARDAGIGSAGSPHAPTRLLRHRPHPPRDDPRHRRGRAPRSHGEPARPRATLPRARRGPGAQGRGRGPRGPSPHRPRLVRVGRRLRVRRHRRGRVHRAQPDVRDARGHQRRRDPLPRHGRPGGLRHGDRCTRVGRRRRSPRSSPATRRTTRAPRAGFARRERRGSRRAAGRAGTGGRLAHPRQLAHAAGARHADHVPAPHHGGCAGDRPAGEPPGRPALPRRPAAADRPRGRRRGHRAVRPGPGRRLRPARRSRRRTRRRAPGRRARGLPAPGRDHPHHPARLGRPSPASRSARRSSSSSSGPCSRACTP